MKKSPRNKRSHDNLDEASPISDPTLNRKLEKLKLVAEYVKHLGTLATGSIVLVVTFQEKLSSHQTMKRALIVAVIGFASCVACSMIYYTLVLTYEPAKKTPIWLDWTADLAIGLTWVGFLVGVIALTLYAAFNL